MRNLLLISLIFSFYSVNAELDKDENILSYYISSDTPSSFVNKWKREANEGISNRGNIYGNYNPSGFIPSSEVIAFQACYESTVAQLQQSGYNPITGSLRGANNNEEGNSNNNAGSLWSNEQFQEIFNKCMEEEKKRSSSTYRKREAESGGSGSSNPLGGYLPSGLSNPFDFTTMWKHCYDYASTQIQESGYIPGSASGSRGEGDKEEGSSNNNSGSLWSNEQFLEMFKKCMEGEKKPSSSTYRKREAESGGSGSNNPLGGYLPSGLSNPFDFTTMWKHCYDYASTQIQESGYIPGSASGSRGEGDKEEGSSNNNSGSLWSNEQFLEMFKKCMEGEKKPSSSTYRKREAESGGSGSSNPLGGYLPSGLSNPFDFTTMWKHCYDYASTQIQESGYIPGSASGSRGEGDKEEGSSNNNSGSLWSNEQFLEMFKKCMEGEKKPSSSTYRKREAESGGSGSSNPLGGYLPSGLSNPFDFTTMWKHCYDYASTQIQESGYIPGSASGSRGEGDKEEGSSNNNSGSLWSNEQFLEMFKKCMEGEKKPSSSTYRKREAESGGSGSSNPLGGYLPSGLSNPFDFTTMWKHCYDYASTQIQESGYIPGSASGSRGEGDKEEGSSNNNSGSLWSNEQFLEMFKKCMEGEKKPSSSTYRKREAESGGSGSSNPLGGYLPSGLSNPFDFTTMWKHCYDYASTQIQESGYIPGSASGSRGEGDKEEGSSNNNSGSLWSNEQFLEMFKKCMEGEKKPSSSTYRKREAESGGSGSSNPLGGYLPSGLSNPFDFTTMWKHCYDYASTQIQESGYIPGSASGSRGEGDKEEGSSNNNSGSLWSNEQFLEMFKKCMEGEKKPSSSTYRKREAESGGSGSSNPLGGYLPSGLSNPFDFTTMWKHCYDYASTQIQESGYIPGSASGSRGEGDKEEGSSNNNSGSLWSNEQFLEMFKKCMEGEKKPSSSTYRKREAESGGSGSSNPLGGYFPSGLSNPFDFTTMWKHCYDYASTQIQESGYIPGSASGSRGEGDKEEGSSNNNSGSLWSNEQFLEMFKKCMEGEKKPPSSTYRKREAESGGSGSSNPLGGYLPSGLSNPFDFTTMWKHCYDYASTQIQESGYIPGSASGSRGEGDKEEGSSNNNSGSLWSNEQFLEMFKKCMEGEKKPSSSTYRKREAESGGSGSSNPLGGYLPSGLSNPFDFTTMWKHCYDYASTQIQESGYIPGSASGSRGEGDKEEGSSNNNSGSLWSNEQFLEMFKKCMEGEKKPSSSTYRKREAESGGSGSSNPLGGYLPSGLSNPFDFTTMWKHCYDYASTQIQESGYIPGSASGSRGEGDKEEGSSNNNSGSLWSNEQFLEMFKKCMEGEKKPSSSTYRKREANLKRRVRKSACKVDQTKRNNVLRHISLFY